MKTLSFRILFSVPDLTTIKELRLLTIKQLVY